MAYPGQAAQRDPNSETIVWFQPLASASIRFGGSFAPPEERGTVTVRVIGPPLGVIFLIRRRDTRHSKSLSPARLGTASGKTARMSYPQPRGLDGRNSSWQFSELWGRAPDP